MDVIINKIESIVRCIKRITEVYQGNDDSLYDYTKQDSIILNLQRAIDIEVIKNIIKNNFNDFTFFYKQIIDSLKKR